MYSLQHQQLLHSFSHLQREKNKSQNMYPFGEFDIRFRLDIQKQLGLADTYPEGVTENWPIFFLFRDGLLLQEEERPQICYQKKE
jgi:hypothetical protein